MEVNDDGSSPCPQLVCQTLRMANEAALNVSALQASIPPARPPGAMAMQQHRRAKSEMIPPMHRRSNSFQRWKDQMQKAWGWGDVAEEEDFHPLFNPEVLMNQKRQWYQLHSKKPDLTMFKEPTSLFEHFVIVGLHSDSNLEALEDAFAQRKTWELEAEKVGKEDQKLSQYHGPLIPIFEPQILFKYPPGKRLAMRPADLPAFCFPEGVKARLLERTPSMSDLNEVVYGQEHLNRDDLSFIFSLKGSDNGTLYGVCVHVQEIVQRSPGILGVTTPLSRSAGGCSRFLVSAPRCYCLLTRVPFFELHYEMLNSIVTQERLNRITEFVTEISNPDYAPVLKVFDQSNENVNPTDGEFSSNWMASAIPLDSALALSAAAAGIILDDEVPSFLFRSGEPHSPENPSASEVSEFLQAKEVDKSDQKSLHHLDDSQSDTPEFHFDSFEKGNGNVENGHTSTEVGLTHFSMSCTLECLERSESLFSSERSMASEDEDVEVGCTCDKNAGISMIMKWAKENKNDLLQIVCGYDALPFPSRGSEIIFQPLEHLQAVKYSRPSVSALGLCEHCPDMKLQGSLEAHKVNVKLAAAEEALSLSIWTIATVCRALSLESVMALFAGVLLEKQVVVVSTNLGILSATILSLIPMIRPFEWQSLLLPVLPRRMFDFLDAPVPFIVGIQHKPPDMNLKTSNLIHVNVDKDQVKMCYLPSLPRRKELEAELAPIHARLSCENSIAKRHPIYKCNELQAKAAGQFLQVMKRYLESLCSDLRMHTITSVQSNNDKVSLLLKDSFIDSFPTRDRPFVKLFVDTQLFSVLSDSRLACYEHD